jgi:hypothetical protein
MKFMNVASMTIHFIFVYVIMAMPPPPEKPLLVNKMTHVVIHVLMGELGGTTIPS